MQPGIEPRSPGPLANTSTQFSSIWPRDRILSGATTPGQRGSGRNGNEGVLRIPQSFSITEASPSDCLVSYLGHSLKESYPSAEMQWVYNSRRVGKSMEGYSLRIVQVIKMRRSEFVL